MNDINPGASTDASSDDRTVALLTHLSGILFNFVVPLIVWLINKDKAEKAFLNDQAKEALNFNLTLLAIYIVLQVLTAITLGLLGLLTVPLMFLLWIVSVVFYIIAGIKANNGERYRYPFAFRLIK
ncbi:DUF4870 domain-containing protein [Vulcaniibacterium thermophilum]|uniref:Membrane protein n=1 Tax=Vulcaniibacterium thermophilum TaxID=1169913 RepID=A0A919D9A8_9GAMM|nr:DUF4870 domain-containing protein [Vulcaniibacterium thermophilum]GHE28932.1 membrane protein [Vulcaniibacterium thermophilum]